MKLVMKFGGTSVGDGSRIKHISNIIAEYVKRGNKIVVVVSAMAGVTDGLQKAIEEARANNSLFIKNFLRRLRSKQLEALSTVQNEAVRQKVLMELNHKLEELEKILMAISYLGEVTSRIEDRVLAFGEQLSTPIVCTVLNELGIQAKYFTGGEAGIITNEKFGRATPLMKLTEKLVKERLDPLLDNGIIPVVAGYIASTEDGQITTLGRGGSDYTASILGVALEVDEIWLWTDVDGIMTADPKIEASAKVIPVLSCAEATEMAYFGAKLLHPRTLEGVIDKGIPVRIKNTFSPDKSGTLIVKEYEAKGEVFVKAVTMTRNVTMLTVNGRKGLDVQGTFSRVFWDLEERGVNIIMISQGSSEANISFVIPRKDLDQAIQALKGKTLENNFIRKIDAESDVCVIAVVGAGMKGKPGIAARVFQAVARENVNIRMIAQGSSELNTSFVVKEDDGEKAVRSIHREFKLSGGDRACQKLR